MNKKCVRDYTVINSQPSREAFENLISDFCGTFGLTETIDDMFYYGVFCKPQNYASFNFDTTFDEKFDIPAVLINYSATFDEKYKYVLSVMKSVMKKEIKKPEWMKFVEMTECSTEYDLAPSTFLYIEPIKPEYEALAQRLVEFLYSPNLTMTMVEA